MTNNHDSTGQSLNRSGAKGFEKVDPARFRFKQSVEALGREMYYIWLASRNIQTPAFEGAGAEVRAHWWGLAEGVLSMAHPALPSEAPVQPVVPHCLPRNVVLTLVPPTIARGKVLLMIEPNQRPS